MKLSDMFWTAVEKSLPDRLRLILARDAAPPNRVVSREEEFGQSQPGRSLPGPGAPILYNQGDELPRLFDYQYSANKVIVPRGEWAVLASFFHLYAFYLANDEVRTAAAWNTNQILGVNKDVRPRKGTKGVNFERWEAAKRLVDFPDPTLDWSYEQWLRALLQERNVTDAVTVYPLKTFGGEVIAWQPIDGQTIKPILSYQGGRPLPPAPAYVQYIKGYPFKPFDLNSLVYLPSRPRVWCAYGESRVEEILNTIAALTLFTNYNNDWFTEGSIPEALMTLPESYFKGEGPTVAKRVANYQRTLDEQAGQSVTRRRFHISPVPADKVQLLKAFEFNSEMPEWYVRKLCVQFGCPPTLFISETNRATSEQVSVDLGDSVFRADLKWVKRLVDRLLAMSGFGDFELILRPTRSFKMFEVQGVIAMNQAIDPETGKPLMTMKQVHAALDMEDRDAGDIEGPGLIPEPDDPEPTAAPASDAPAPGTAPAAPTPVPTAAKTPPGTAPVTGSPSAAKIERSAPTVRPAARPGAKAAEYRHMADRHKLTAKMLGSVRPMLDEKKRVIREKAVRLAASRGKKVTGA